MDWWCAWGLPHIWKSFSNTLRSYCSYRICRFCAKSQRKVLDHPWRDV